MAVASSLEKGILRGGAFIIEEPEAHKMFIPEEFDEEAHMIQDMAADFVEKEVNPKKVDIEKQKDNIAATLLERAGELGLLGSHMPEEFGGMELDDNLNTFIYDAIGAVGSWSVAYAAHTGIGMLPILYFGTQEQKDKYLPRLISGELKAAYCLTEPGSGSDALAAKTRADYDAGSDSYSLTGQKMWITNAGFADVFVVFAQVDGDKFTGFIVERDSEGLTLGAEEDKLGIKGSSTRQVFFEKVQVPAANVLGEIGKGHLIAFNALNIGRFKLAALSMGGCKNSISTAVKYANERIQFGQPIASFGAIKYKLAEQAIRTFTLESTIYRVSNLLKLKKEALVEEGLTFAEAKLKAAEEYAIECSILKVAGSEVLDYVVDETLQVHGGMGYSEEGTAARAYRDARINRIYEGTNEINRLLTVDMLLRRAMKGRIDIVGPAWEVQKELASMPSMDQPTGDYAQEQKAVREFKKLVLMVAGGAAKMQMDGELNMKEEQEIVMNVADMMIDTYLAESLLMRVMKLKAMSDKPADQAVYDAILQTFVWDATARISTAASNAIASFAKGDVQRVFFMGLKRYTKYPPVNVKENRRLVADALIAADAYSL